MDLEKIEKQLKGAPSTSESDTEKARRLTAESELLTDFEDVLEGAISDVILKRHNELKDLDKARIDKAIAEAEKAGDKWSADTLKTYNEALKTRYIYTTGGSTKIDKDTIKADNQKLAADGEDGAKVIFTEMTGLKDEAAEKDDIANQLFPPTGRARATDYSSLSDQQKFQVDEIYRKRIDQFNNMLNDQKAGLETTAIQSMLALS